jgi:acyl-CoA reductase-like NAD-dependent aldehyde dehydrogenase
VLAAWIEETGHISCDFPSLFYRHLQSFCLLSRSSLPQILPRAPHYIMFSSKNGHTANGTTSLDFTTFHNTINGKSSSTKQTRHGINPATTEPNAEVPVSTPSDVDAAVAAARAAFKSWSKVPVEERQKAVSDFADAIMEHKEEFAKMLVKEQGKPLPMAQTEVDGAFGLMKEISKMSVSEEVVEEDEKRKVIVRYTPLGSSESLVPDSKLMTDHITGVVCGIVPW